MALQDEEKAMLLSSAMNGYIFNTLFEQKNPGFEFDGQAFLNKLDEITDDPMFAISKDAQEKLTKCVSNLDDFKKIKNAPTKEQSPQLTLV